MFCVLTHPTPALYLSHPAFNFGGLAEIRNGFSWASFCKKNSGLLQRLVASCLKFSLQCCLWICVHLKPR
ncbi:hypothetical protein GJAV_G00193320, partial [Gymnothorax javanicus]